MVVDSMALVRFFLIMTLIDVASAADLLDEEFMQLAISNNKSQQVAVLAKVKNKATCLAVSNFWNQSNSALSVINGALKQNLRVNIPSINLVDYNKAITNLTGSCHLNISSINQQLNTITNNIIQDKSFGNSGSIKDLAGLNTWLSQKGIKTDKPVFDLIKDTFHNSNITGNRSLSGSYSGNVSYDGRAPYSGKVDYSGKKDCFGEKF
jgi:hypothetical protein